MSDSSQDLQQTVKMLVARVDELESRSAIRDLVTDYCVGFDQQDWDKFISIWHQDAVWEIGEPFGTFKGHEGIKKAVYEVLYPVWRETHHLSTNLKIEFLDADHAKGCCGVDCMGATKDDIVQMINATYEDDFERRDGVWRISKRTVTMHYFNPIPNAEMSAP